MTGGFEVVLEHNSKVDEFIGKVYFPAVKLPVVGPFDWPLLKPYDIFLPVFLPHICT